ncbi:CpsD/CapB family tyrosine-protein kinase [Pseudalkalibacillus caeni]|uniref:CpsD/CapB family tyrosine-protein kinase n=1 Tax=Exobacillus caeni TaxID=2574798 RepID=UPI00148534EF|nr:CpsD/CapB family tyrosine-protein kinase [Pseudalkalibacillus caeni]
MARSDSSTISKFLKKSVVITENPNSVIAEQFRTLRTNLQFISKTKELRSLIVTSPSYGEGKTTTSVNLAISIAEQGKKVLVVDGNLRNPGVHASFKLKNSLGLTNVLLGETTFKEAINRTEIGRLDVVTSGTLIASPSKLIKADTISNIIEECLEEYDLVIFDAPPVLEVSDTNIISNLFDGVILVICQNKTKRDDAIEAKRMLEMAEANLIGITLNKKR